MLIWALGCVLRLEKLRNWNEEGSCLCLSQAELVSLQAGGIQNDFGALGFLVNANNAGGVKDFVSVCGRGKVSWITF